MRFQGKTILITGGARGIGLTTALMMAAEGGRVGIVALSPDNLRKAAETARARGLALATFQGDVSRTDQVQRTMNAFLETFGRIDILVNNAGMTIPKPFMERTAEDWIRTLEVNLIGVFLCSQAAAKHMLAQKSGKIVNVSSIGTVSSSGKCV